MQTAYLSRRFNVVLVDWKKLTHYPCYFSALGNTKLVAQCTAQVRNMFYAQNRLLRTCVFFWMLHSIEVQYDACQLFLLNMILITQIIRMHKQNPLQLALFIHQPHRGPHNLTPYTVASLNEISYVCVRCLRHMICCKCTNSAHCHSKWYEMMSICMCVCVCAFLSIK